MAKLNETKATSVEHVLLYGAPKTGKTQLAGELSEFFNLIFIDLEQGHNTLYKLPEEWQKRIELVSIPDSTNYPVAIETMGKMMKGRVNICDLHGKVSCMLCQKSGASFVEVDLYNLPSDTIVIVDSDTQLTSSAIAIIANAMSDPEAKFTFDEWGKLAFLMERFHNPIQTLPCNLVVISHENEVEVTGKKTKVVPVAGSSKFSRNVAKYFDHVIYAEKKNGKHTFASDTSYANNIITGSRTDAVLEGAGKPSLLAIFKPEIYAEREAATAATAATTKSLGAGKKVGKVGTTKTSSASILANLKAKSKT